MHLEDLDEDLGEAMSLAAETCSTTLKQVLAECLMATIVEHQVTVGEAAMAHVLSAMRVIDAIVDSGASYTYVAGTQELTNVRPGRGRVKCANGQVERVAKIGDLGPLRGARKVQSFDKTLVSVTDLVEQFGRVVFDTDGVAVETKGGESKESLSTYIGKPTANRLYKFDLEALERHQAKVRNAARRGMSALMAAAG